MVCDYIASLCTEYNFSSKSVVSALSESLNESDVVILAAPTYDHWVLHTPYERFLDKAGDISLEKKYIVIGLWDNKYDNEYNVEAVPILEKFVSDHWWTILCDSLKINKNPVDQLDSHVKQWIEKVLLPALKTV